MRRRHFVPWGLALAFAVSACGGREASAPPRSTRARPAPAEAGRPRAPVVVGIVVDQLASWIAASRLEKLPESGGFARLRREGTWAVSLRYAHAVTDTAPGHASLHTGVVPAESGIVANEVPDAHGERVSILRDETTKLLGPEGPIARAGSSAIALRAKTVADRLREKDPRALVISVALKDRGAILPGGKQPSHVFWYDAMSGAFVTSSAFADRYPTWAARVGSSAANEERRRVPWTLSDRAWVEANAAAPDDGPGEGDFEGLGTTFPHVAKTPGAFRAVPASDDALVDLALAALDAEYDPSRPTLLLVSFSAYDIMSHVFGPDSWEAWDHLRRLDATLARLVDGVEAKVGPAAFLLSADHGAESMPETRAARLAPCPAPGDAFERSCAPGARISSDGLRDELRAATAKAVPGGPWIHTVSDPYVHLTPAARALPPAQRDALDRAVRATLAKEKLTVREVFDVRELATECPKKLATAAKAPERARPGEDVLTLVCRSWSPHLGVGDYYVVPTAGSYFGADYTPGRGTSHGTPYLYDRSVPLLVRARGAIAEGERIDAPVDFSAYAAVAASLLGIDPRTPADVLASLRAP